MTRAEFDDIIDFSELKDFCTDHGCELLDNVIEDIDLDSFIDEDIRNALQHEYWYTVREELNNIPDDGAWYVRNSRLDYGVLTEEGDFDAYWQSVLDWAEDNDVFEPEEDEDGEEPFAVPAPPVPQEPEFEVDSAVFDALFPLSA